MEEIKRFGVYAEANGMRKWEYGDERILELRYEDMIANESEQFERLFSHYGFHENAIQVCLKLAATQSFAQVSKRRLGETNSQAHLRSGKPGEWKTVLSKSHLELIDELLGNLISKMGY